MVYCSKCGSENGDNATVCSTCGEQLKEEPDNGKKLINWEALFLGGITWIILFFVFVSIYLFTKVAMDNFLYVIQFIIGLVAGYISRDFLGSIVNAAILATVVSAIYWTVTISHYSTSYITYFSLTLFVFGIIGGIVGFFIKNRLAT